MFKKEPGMRKIRRIISIYTGLCVSLCGLLLCGCATLPMHKKNLNKGQKAFRKGDLQTAYNRLSTFTEKNKQSKDAVLACLEMGSLYRFNSEPEKSLRYFRGAEQLIAALMQEPEFKLSDEGAAVLTNLRALPYKGKNYERIMMNTYKALNYMILDEFDKARVELRKAYEWQAEAVHRNKKRIEKAKQAAKKRSRKTAQKQDQKEKQKKGGTFDIQRARKDEKFQKNLKKLHSSLEKFNAYADYVNPFCEWLQAVYYMAVSADSSDLERARKSLERVQSMAKNNPYVAEDLKLAQKRAKGGRFPAVTYVVFATGSVPDRGQIRLDIPLFLASDDVDYVGANFPRLIEDKTFVDTLTVNTGNKSYSTELLADMDSIVAHEFKNNLPVIVIKTLISTAVKTALAAEARSATEGQGSLSIITRVGTTLYQAAMNQADTRSWESLPKQFQYARCPTPDNGCIVLSLPDGRTRKVQVTPQGINVVFVRSFKPETKVYINKFAFSK